MWFMSHIKCNANKRVCWAGATARYNECPVELGMKCVPGVSPTKHLYFPMIITSCDTSVGICEEQHFSHSSFFVPLIIGRGYGVIIIRQCCYFYNLTVGIGHLLCRKTGYNNAINSECIEEWAANFKRFI